MNHPRKLIKLEPIENNLHSDWTDVCTVKPVNEVNMAAIKQRHAVIIQDSGRKNYVRFSCKHYSTGCRATMRWSKADGLLQKRGEHNHTESLPLIKCQPDHLESPALQIKRQPELCEICDFQANLCESLSQHVQAVHPQLMDKFPAEMAKNEPPLLCSRCQTRFWTYEGMERHLLMAHGLVSANLMAKAMEKKDAGKCKLCGTVFNRAGDEPFYPHILKEYAFYLLKHLIRDHSVELFNVEIMYSCNTCYFKCSCYQTLEKHLAKKHPKR